MTGVSTNLDMKIVGIIYMTLWGLVILPSLWLSVRKLHQSYSVGYLTAVRAQCFRVEREVIAGSLSYSLTHS